MDCPDANDVARFLDGEASAAAAAAFEDHIDACADCRGLVTELGRVLDPPDGARGSRDETWEVQSGAEIVERGTQIDRYVVLDEIGAGAMGVVYRAYDPELDRDVALKLVRVLGNTAGRDRARSRLLREAQAMARLSHPNVVAVYDASVFGSHVFVAMELVDGVDLEAWLARETRPWREIAAAFVAAGRGLVAAHAAGIVHRDFKPTNVLVGDDGRVRVTDFGLAVSTGEATPGAPVEAGDSRLTETGTLVGTPAYLSPEVRAGSAADERSDQYSFAIALCEAVTGERGSSPKLPAALRGPIARALSASPAGRYPDMQAMTDALQRALVPRLRRALPFVAVGLLAIATFAGYRIAHREPAVTCAPPTARLAGIWDAPRKATLRAAFAATGHALAAEQWARAEASLDRFAIAWSASHVAACEATHVRGEQSGELLDRRMACLGTELARLAAVTEMFARADRDVVGRAIGASDLTERLARCSDVVALREAAALPADPALRARATAATSELARVETVSLRGRYAEAITDVQPVIAEAKATGDLRLEADALRSLGESQWRAGDHANAIKHLHDAVDAAKRGRAPDLEAGALLTLVAVLGYEDARYAEALQVARLAESAIRASGDDSLLAKLLGNRAAIHYAKSDYKAALADYEQSLVLFERAFGPVDRRVGQMVMNLAMLAAEMEQYERAFALYARALAIHERALGPRHPEVALTLANRAIALANTGRHGEGIRDLERVHEMRTELLDPTHPDVTSTRFLMGEIETDRGEHASALAHYRAVLAAQDKQLRSDHPQRAATLSGIGRALAGAKHYAEAIRALDQALAIWDKLALDGAMQASTRFTLARSLWESGGDQRRARALAEQARAGFTGHPEQQAEVATWLTEHR